MYRSAWENIIKTKRYEYYPDDLGPIVRIIGDGITTKRIDFEVLNYQNHKLQASFFHTGESPNPDTPCILYMHSHSGNRLEGLPITKLVSDNFSVCLFDFSGAGISEGKYVSLGKKEAFDIQAIFDVLQSQFKVRHFMLWGRSMGAVATILFLKQGMEDKVKGVIFDSPFTNSKEMVKNKKKIIFQIVDLVKEHSGLPEFIIKMGLLPIGTTIQEESGFDVMNINPISEVAGIHVPGMFMVGKEDKICAPEKVKNMHDCYGGPKAFKLIKGDHIEFREFGLIKECIQFLEDCWQEHLDQKNQIFQKISEQSNFSNSHSSIGGPVINRYVVHQNQRGDLSASQVLLGHEGLYQFQGQSFQQRYEY